MIRTATITRPKDAGSAIKARPVTGSAPRLPGQGSGKRVPFVELVRREYHKLRQMGLAEPEVSGRLKIVRLRTNLEWRALRCDPITWCWSYCLFFRQA